MPKLNQLQGLKASDRNINDTREINKLNTAAYNPYSNNQEPPKSILTYAKKISENNQLNYNLTNQLALKYRNSIEDEDPKWNNKIKAQWAKDVAKEYSNYYKRFNGETTKNPFTHDKYIDFTDEEWADIYATYRATAEVQGTEKAIELLDQRIKDRVGKNQPWYEQAWNSQKGVVTNIGGDIITLAGMAYGTVNYFINYDNVEGLGILGNFLNSVMDNEVTRYADDLMKYGSLHPADWLDGAFLPSEMTKYKETGIGINPIVETTKQENSLISSATPWIANQSYGHEVAMAAISAGTSAATKQAFNLARKGTQKVVKNQVGRKAADLASDVLEKRARAASIKAMENISKVEKFTNSYVIPGLTGSVESFMEGLNTKQAVREEGLRELNAQHQQEVTKRMNEIAKNNGYTPGLRFDPTSSESNKDKERIFFDKQGNIHTESEIRQQAERELQSKYNESLEQIEYAAANAGVNNFALNSVVNGFINSTLKVGLQHPRVQKSLQSSKLTKWAQPQSKFSISGEGANIAVKAKDNFVNRVFNVVKEPVGEFIQESYQNITDATMTAAGENNIHEFIQNKYLGDGSAKVGENFASDFSKAWETLKEETFSKETIKAGIMGAMGSMMGGIHRPTKIRTGRVNEDGTPEYTILGRGVNESGNQESRLSQIGRILPWQSGLTRTMRINNLERKENREIVESLQNWLRDTNNRAKFDGLVGTQNWAKKMAEAANINDEFGFRNSYMGKTINDAMMLNHLKGTKYYDVFMDQITRVANMEKGSEDANKFVADYKKDPTVIGHLTSEEEIFDTLKKNANTMLSTIDKYQQEDENITKLLGNVDLDTRQSLIYGKIMLEDWGKRSKELREEIEEIQIDNSTDSTTPNSDLSKDQQQIVAQYGSIKEAQKAKAEIDKRIIELREDIKNITSRKNKTTQDKEALKFKKRQIVFANKESKKLEAVKGLDANIETILNEQDIMSLDPQTRATMLRRGGEKTYTSFHGGNEAIAEKKAQLEQDLANLEANKKTYIDSRGRVKKHYNKQIEKINKQIENTKNIIEGLNGKEKSYYSEAQQEVLDKLISQGTFQDAKFLDKIIDLGRIEANMDRFQKQYLDILSDTDSFNTYVYNAKLAAKDMLSANRFEALNKIEDYTEFANELDALLESQDGREVNKILEAFTKRDNKNFNTWINSRGRLEEVLNHAFTEDSYKNLSANNKDVITSAFMFLSNKGVNLLDEKAVREALSKTDGDGISQFRKYIDKLNVGRDNNDKIFLGDFESHMNDYLSITNSYKDHIEEVNRNRESIVFEDTNSNNPVYTEAPKPTTQVKQKKEEDKKKENKKKEDKTTKKENKLPQEVDAIVVEEDSVLDINDPFNIGNSFTAKPKEEVVEDNQEDKGLYEEGSLNNEDVESLINNLLKRINVDRTFDKEMRQEARDLIEAVVETLEENDKVEDVVDKINVKALDGSNQIKSFIPLIINEVTTKKEKPIVTIPESNDNNLTIIESTQFSSIRKYPGPIQDFYVEHRIEQAINDGVLDEDSEGNPPTIYFLTDKELTEKVMASYDGYIPNKDYPIILAVKSKNGKLSINGELYQPICVLQSSKNVKHNKKNTIPTLEKTRQIAQKSRNLHQSSKVDFIYNEDGALLTTTQSGSIRANVSDRNERVARDVFEIAFEDLYEDQKEELRNSPSLKAMRESSIYKNIRKRFLSRLERVSIDDRIVLQYKQDNLKSSNIRTKSYNKIEVFVKPISETTAKDSDDTLLEAIQKMEVINFNSRTKGAARAIDTTINLLRDAINLYNPDRIIQEGKSIEDLKKVVEEKIQEAIKGLHKNINNYITISACEYIPEIRYSENGEIFVNLKLNYGYEGNSIDLYQFNRYNINSNDSNTNTNREITTSILNNIFSDGINLREKTFDGKQVPLVLWQVNYADAKDSSTNKNADRNMQEIYDDGILKVPATTFNYKINQIDFNSPFGNPTQQVVNPTNADPIVDSIAEEEVKNSTTQETSKEKEESNKSKSVMSTEPYLTAERKLNEIVERSKSFTINEDGFYVDGNGKIYARVTSIIQTSEEKVGERFDSNSLWMTPSTTIGNLIDNIGRTIFSGNEVNLEDYPNFSKEEVENLSNQFKEVKDNILRDGGKIYASGITLTGTMPISRYNPNTYTTEKVHIPVAGTVDLLVLNADGSIEIYDFKTFRSDIKDEKIKGYTRQVHAYSLLALRDCGLLTSKWGILPIKVNYEDPIRNNMNYLSDNGVLTSNGEVYEGINPTYTGIIPIEDYKETNLLWDKLTDKEKSLLDNNAEDLNNFSDEDACMAAINESSVFSDLFGSPIQSFNSTSIIAEEQLEWNNLRYKQAEGLSKKDITEEDWNKLNTVEKERQLECLGI